MSGPIGRDNRRLDQLERELSALRSQLSTLQARLAITNPPQGWRFGVTAKLLDESTYPTEGSGADTFGVRFADLEFSPLATGASTIEKHYRSAKAKVPARSLSGYIPEGTPVVAFWSAVPGAATNAGCWYIALAGSVSGLPIRFRLTSSISVFGSGNGVRQKWDSGSSDWIDDPDFPDTETLFDYVGSASTGDPNDKCFAVEVPDHPGVFEIVEIQQAGGLEMVVFKLDQEGGITEDDATADALVVASYGAGLDPDDPITVSNYPSHVGGQYAFRRPNGYTGVAIKSGSTWLIVDMEEQVKVAEIEFICNQTVATTDATFDVEVTRILGDADLLGVAEEDEIEVHNRPDITDYVFTGSNLTSVGLARWDHRLLQWDVIWITCPTE